MSGVCPLCESNSLLPHTFREMMFGTRAQFAYHECARCGHLWIAAVPDDLSRFYGEGYYSFNRAFPWHKRWSYKLHFRLAERVPAIREASGGAFGAVLRAGLRRGQRVLDVGCGSGQLVGVLNSVGLHAMGIDAFVEHPGPRVRRQTLEETAPGWDLVMFHHSLEHMPDPVAALATARRLLNPGGQCLVRLPIAAWAWKHYGADWVQLDAPRHLSVPTETSFRLACERAGFRVARVVFDSGVFQFTGSELYRRDLPLTEAAKHPSSRAERRRYRARARELNKAREGDQAAFYLHPA